MNSVESFLHNAALMSLFDTVLKDTNIVPQAGTPPIITGKDTSNND